MSRSLFSLRIPTTAWIIGLGLLNACGVDSAGSSAISGGTGDDDVVEAKQTLATCPVSASDRGYVKWRPGNYILEVGGANPDQVGVFLNNFNGVANVQGLQREYFWSQIEKSRGVYDWSTIDADIAKLAAANKKLAIIIKYKYQISDTKSSLPQYILNFSNVWINGVSVPPYFEQGKPGDGPFNQGQHANFGHPRTQNRFKALLSALAAKYDSNPNVVSLSFIETATGSTVTNNDTQEDIFLNGVMEIERHASCVLLHTPVFQNLNFPRRRLADFAENFQQYGIGLGGPDVFWGSMSDPENALGYNVAGKPKGIYHYYPLLSGIIPIGQQVHLANYIYPTHESMRTVPPTPHNLSPSASVSKLYDFSMRQLKPNYMFWWVGGSADEYGNALRARLNNDGLPLLTACPSVYGNRCTAI